MAARSALALALLAAFAGPGCKNRTDRIPDTLTCTAGESLLVGCTSRVGSPCSGDPAIDVCDGTVVPSACDATTRIATADDVDGACPELVVTCPASGRVTIVPRPATPGGASACYWDVHHGGM